METVLAGRYLLLKPLGGGGFGQTFLASDRHLPKQPICVVKQFKPRSNQGDSLRAAKRLFDLEAETLYRLGNHNQIPRLLAHFEEAGEFYLVQEWIEGESLQQELDAQGSLAPSAGIALLQDLLEVLAFVHQENVIHRDIKPSNLIHRQADRRFVLIDFGAVKQVTVQPGQGANGQPELTVAVGSPGYMPPEQLSSRPHFSSDLYALGIVVLQAMSGIPAIELPRDPETGEICCAMLGDRLLLPPNLAHFIDTLVRYDYRDRYPTAVHALNALQKIDLAIDLAIDRSVGSREHLAIHSHSNRSDSTNSLERSPAETTPHPTQQDPIPTVRQSNQPETLPPLADPSFVQRLPPIPSFPPVNPAHPHPYPDLSSQEYRNRQALLNKVKNFWVRGVLETSLHDQVFLVLGLEARSDAVSTPWNVTIAANEPLRYFPQGTQIGSIFAQMGTGRSLLILGEPGAGKTTTLLQLARDLIGQAEQDVTQLIPVVLNLSSWTGAPQTIAQWVVEELNLKYQVPKRVGQAWVEHQQLLLLLDGLDEVRSTQRDACVKAINQFQQAHSTELVVCSRIRDYEALSHRLKVQIAVAVRSLTPEQIQSYLDSLSTDLSGLKQLLQTDEAFRELAQSPLLLNMMVLAYQGITLTDLPKPEVLAKRRSQVFDAYIERMFQRQGAAQLYSPPQTIVWLSWLAQQMMWHSQTIVLIERIQRSWLHTSKQRLIYTLISAFTISTLLGLIYGIATAVSFGVADGLRIGLLTWAASTLLQAIVIWFVVAIERLPNTPQQVARQNVAYSVGTGVILGISIGMIGAIDRGIALGGTLGFMSGAIGGVVDWLTGSHFTQSALGLTETLKWSWKRIRAQLWFWLPIGIATGLGFHGLGLLSPNLVHSLLNGAITGTVAAIATGLDASSEIETKTQPNQGIWQSAKNCLLIACLTTPTLVLSALLLSVPLYIALIFSWLISLNLGGSACVVHLSLRLTFWLDRRMPWNDARFLNYATQLTFLQKVGGGYLFVHRLLLEHFAQQSLPQEFPSPKG